MSGRTLCSAIIRRTGRPCGCLSNDGSGRCGRHGGLSRRRVGELLNSFEQTRGLLPSEEYRDLTMLISLMSISPGVTPKRSPALKKVKDYDCFICIDSHSSGGVELPCCKKTCCSSCLDQWSARSNACPHCRASM